MNDTESKVSRVDNSWMDSVESIIRFGKELAQKKEELSRVEFENFISNEFGMRLGKAFKLIYMSRHPIISDPQNASNLPAKWSVLARLSAVKDRALLVEEMKKGNLKEISESKINDVFPPKEKKEIDTPSAGGKRERRLLLKASQAAEHRTRDLFDSIQIVEGVCSSLFEKFGGMKIYTSDESGTKDALERLEKCSEVIRKIKRSIKRGKDERLNRPGNQSLDANRLDPGSETVNLMGKSAASVRGT